LISMGISDMFGLNFSISALYFIIDIHLSWLCREWIKTWAKILLATETTESSEKIKEKISDLSVAKTLASPFN